MSEVGKLVIEGAEDILAYLKGDKSRATTYVLTVPDCKDGKSTSPKKGWPR